MKKLRKKRLFFIIALCSILFWGGILCNFTSASNVQAATNIKLSDTVLTMLKKDTYTLKLSESASKIKWTSSNTSVATVNKNGKVKAKNLGTATIIAKIKGKSYKCKVTVTTKDTIKTELKKISEWYTIKTWNQGLCDISSYIYDGTDSTGDNLNINKCIKNYRKAIKKKTSYSRYINSLTNKKYSNLKITWDEMMNQVEILTKIIDTEEIKANSDIDFSTYDLQIFHWKFSSYISKL